MNEEKLVNACCGIIRVYEELVKSQDDLVKEISSKDKSCKIDNESAWAGIDYFLFILLWEYRLDILDCDDCKKWVKKEMGWIYEDFINSNRNENGN